jgi:HAD superfamily hydrolase (TIGR01509 family)
MTNFALIFDLDGVIADTASLHQKAWIDFVHELGLQMSPETFRNRLFGRANQEIFNMVLDRQVDGNELRELSIKKEQLYRHYARGKLKPLGGLQHFLESARAAHIPMAVASSAPLINIEFTLRETNLAAWFNHIASAEEMTRGKPDPQIFEITAEKLGFAPKMCLVFEDSYAGLEAAQKANMKVIGIASTHSADEISGNYPVVKDFKEVDLNLVREQFNKDKV